MINVFGEGRVGLVYVSTALQTTAANYSQSLWTCRVASKLVRQVESQIQEQPQSLLHSVCFQFSVKIVDAHDTCRVCFLCGSCILVCCSDLLVSVFADW